VRPVWGAGWAGAARLKNTLIGLVLGLIARLWLMTLRLEVHVDEALEVDDARPWVLSFFHGTQFALLAWPRRRRTAVMVSHSQDGQIQASALRMNGLQIVRGSSSRGGARGLAGLVRLLKRGSDCAFAVDGPRGPYGIAKSGALCAAQRVGGLLVPMGSAALCARVFEKAWDKFTLPQPFSRVIVTLGAPLDPKSATSETLANAIHQANDRARAQLTISSSVSFWRQVRPRRSRHARPSASL
jgi:lysophospholipid acyltransferase (LPLAT)-like uncharacterized protein